MAAPRISPARRRGRAKPRACSTPGGVRARPRGAARPHDPRAVRRRGRAKPCTCSTLERCGGGAARSAAPPPHPSARPLAGGGLGWGCNHPLGLASPDALTPEIEGDSFVLAVIASLEAEVVRLVE